MGREPYPGVVTFYPQFCMGELPPTSRAHAEACCRAARAQGLRNVRLANQHLLW